MKKEKINNIFTIVLFQICSLSIIIGISISCIFIVNYPSNNLGQILPVIISFAIASILKSIYIFLVTKEFNLIKIHMKKNWIIYDWIAIFINIFNMIFALCFITITANLGFWTISTNKIFIILLVALTFSISLLSIGFHQYFMYKVRIDLEKRKQGE